MNRDECRKAIKWFEEHDLLDRVEDLDHSVMHCYRCDAALDRGFPSSGSSPWISSRAGARRRQLRQGHLPPARWTQTYTTWMENLKDWCISRQLWWATASPCSTARTRREDALTEDTDVYPKCGGHHVHQDENVLDTWFSSQLWTFHAGLPAKDGTAQGPSSHDGARHRARHHRAVGRPHGHELAVLPGRGAV